jgi:uncharacterized protein (TIGR02466 family)
MKTQLFSIPIWRCGLEINAAQESAKCLDFAKKVPSVGKSNIGGYQSPSFALENLFPAIAGAILPELDSICKELNTALLLDIAWININKKGDLNFPHTHGGAVLSGVVYLNVPDTSGGLVFKNPTQLAYMSSATNKDNVHNILNGLYVQTYTVQPTSSELIVFPGHLEHYVEPNQVEDPRISIAFNMVLA